MGNKNIMEYETVDIDLSTKELLILDQTKLPGTTEILRLSTAKEIWDAIYLLQVRGAPAIGVSAAFGIYILATQIEADDFDSFYAEFAKQRDYLDSSRPTAVNLSWALKRMDAVCVANKDKFKDELLDILLKEAIAIKEEDKVTDATCPVWYSILPLLPLILIISLLRPSKTKLPFGSFIARSPE